MEAAFVNGSLVGASGPDEMSDDSAAHTTNGGGPDATAADSNGHNEAASGANSHRDNRPPKELGKTDQEIVRLIGQHLKIIGLEHSAEVLFEESGCQLENNAAIALRKHVMAGDWEKAALDLRDLAKLMDRDLDDDENMQEMRFLLLEQKYLEFLEENRTLDALNVLRNELTPLEHNTPRVHQLSSYMMCPTNQELYQRASWEGKGAPARIALMEKIQSFLPASVMLPPRRLRTLLQQAVQKQMDGCEFHNMVGTTEIGNVSLLSDHSCSQSGMPMQHRQTLESHTDEVWYCKFSPDGLKLATGSKDTNVIIWDVCPDTLLLEKRRTLEGHACGISFLTWSPDSKHLLVGGPEDCPDLWIWNIEEESFKLRMCQAADDSLTCASFNADGSRFVTGGIKGQFYLANLDGTMIDQWDGVRVNGLYFKKDGKTVLAADTHNRIRGYVFDSQRTDYNIVQEQGAIMTISVNSTERLALLNISTQGIHLWDLQDKVLVRRFQGVTQGNYTIYSTFGGTNENFIASGSEDCHVYIWHIRHEEPLMKLKGHTRTVNCVSWNPVYPALLASASDDGTVRIWGPKDCVSAASSNKNGDTSTNSTQTQNNATGTAVGKNDDAA